VAWLCRIILDSLVAIAADLRILCCIAFVDSITMPSASNTAVIRMPAAAVVAAVAAVACIAIVGFECCFIVRTWGWAGMMLSTCLIRLVVKFLNLN